MCLSKYELENNVPFKLWLHERLEWTPDQDELEVYVSDWGYAIQCPDGSAEYCAFGACGKPCAVYLNKDSIMDTFCAFENPNAGFFGYVRALDNRVICDWLFTKEQILKELKYRGILIDTTEKKIEVLQYFSDTVLSSVNNICNEFLPTINNIADCMLEKFTPPAVMWLN